MDASASRTKFPSRAGSVARPTKKERKLSGWDRSGGDSSEPDSPGPFGLGLGKRCLLGPDTEKDQYSTSYTDRPSVSRGGSLTFLTWTSATGSWPRIRADLLISLYPYQQQYVSVTN